VGLFGLRHCRAADVPTGLRGIAAGLAARVSLALPSELSTVVHDAAFNTIATNPHIGG
jgi:hypothetical protein